MQSKLDQVLWQVTVGLAGILVLGGAAWATTINIKVDKIAGLEANIEFIKNELSDIKKLIKGNG